MFKYNEYDMYGNRKPKMDRYVHEIISSMLMAFLFPVYIIIAIFLGTGRD